MPGTPLPVAGPLGPWWTATLTAIQTLQQQAKALKASQATANITDAYGNTIELSGTNLSQIVTIGASFGQAGVQVGTNLPLSAGIPQSGRAKQTNLATGTITTTAGSTAATLISTASGTFTSGQVIGAANVSDPSSGIATPAITPGTTFTISGAAVTLSQNAAESGTAIFCAAANFTRIS
jgi:hypothetical protein